MVLIHPEYVVDAKASSQEKTPFEQAVREIRLGTGA